MPIRGDKLEAMLRHLEGLDQRLDTASSMDEVVDRLEDGAWIWVFVISGTPIEPNVTKRWLSAEKALLRETYLDPDTSLRLRLRVSMLELLGLVIDLRNALQRGDLKASALLLARAMTRWKGAIVRVEDRSIWDEPGAEDEPQPEELDSNLELRDCKNPRCDRRFPVTRKDRLFCGRSCKSNFHRDQNFT